MKDIQATLRRLDEEIVGHRQQIARHQVEIARLQDTRVLLMGLAEDDIAHAEAAKANRVSALATAGEHAKPVLIVRKTGSGDEDGTESQRRKTGGTTLHASVNGHATKSEKPKKKRKPSAGSESGEMRAKIMKIMDADTPMTSREIGDFLGLPRDETARKPMSNALYQLKVKGALIRDAENRYVVPSR